MNILRKIIFGPAALLMLLLAVPGVFYAQSAPSCPADFKPVEYADLSLCSGKWYEIARYPNFFQKNLVGGTAVWTNLENGGIHVLFSGRKHCLDGKEITSSLKGWIVDKQSNSVFRVMFFWPFSGKYWVVAAGRNYEYAVISKHSRSHLWIMCRKPEMDEKTYDAVLKQLEAQGFDLSKLVKVPQEVVQKPIR